MWILVLERLIHYIKSWSKNFCYLHFSLYVYCDLIISQQFLRQSYTPRPNEFYKTHDFHTKIRAVLQSNSHLAFNDVSS